MAVQCERVVQATPVNATRLIPADVPIKTHTGRVEIPVRHVA
jgi:hypothetical protein